MCDPIRGTIGRARVLRLSPADIQFSDRPADQPRKFTQEREPTAGPHPPNGAALAHYSSSLAFELSFSTNSNYHVLRHIIQMVTVDPSRLFPTAELKSLIDELPPWSADAASQQQYHEFFQSFGTHVFTTLALGGVLRVTVNSTEGASAEMRRTVNGSNTREAIGSRRYSSAQTVTIFRDGGGSAAAEVVSALQHHFADPSTSDWETVQERWIESLAADPVFCSDDPNTKYEPLHNLQGLTEFQRKDLEQASKFYQDQKLRHYESETPGQRTNFSPQSRGPTARKENSQLRKFKDVLARLACA